MKTQATIIRILLVWTTISCTQQPADPYEQITGKFWRKGGKPLLLNI